MTTTELLLASIDEAYDKTSWHGPNLRGALRGVTLDQAGWRPADDRHNIWELMVHAAYWKCDIRRRLNGESGGEFALEGSNFWLRPVHATAAEWQADLAILTAEHESLRKAVAAFPPARWTRKAPGKPHNFEGLARGVAAHDLYHAGQIQLLRRLQES